MKKELKEIITDETLLVTRAEEVNALKENKYIRNIVSELKQIIRDKNIRALSAPAIGYNKRVFCINFQDNEIKTFINPIITHAVGLTLAKETCSSLPGRTFLRPRNSEITVMYENLQSKVESRKLVGLAAIVFQHEVDHLDSVLLSDIGLEIDDDFETATDEEKQEIVNLYLDSLDMKSSTLKQEIDSNPEEKEVYDAIKFMKGISDGTVTLQNQVLNKKEEKEQ